jgi:hypothetical protein
MNRKPYRWLNRRVAAFGPHLTLCLAEDELKSIAKKFNKQGLEFPTSGAVCHAFTYDNSGDFCAIVSVSLACQQNATPIDLVGVLVHEAVHVWQHHAAHICEDRPGDEQEAQAIQGISQELMREYARRLHANNK